MRLLSLLAILFVLFISAVSVQAGLNVNISAVSVQPELKVNGLFTDHMVLQRDHPVAVYGTGVHGDSITVSFCGQKQTAVVDPEGNWEVVLDPMPANSEPQVLTIFSQSANSGLQFSDVLVGDVWLCSGQSNMASVLKAYPTLKDDIPEMENKLVRLFKITHGGVGAEIPSDMVVPDSAFGGSWQVMSPEFAKEFSAVGCIFGRALQPQVGVPIGLISANRGGTMVNQWLSLEVMQKKPTLYSTVLDKNWKYWTAPVAAPGYMYNGTIHPLIRYSIRGVIWYQGESDVIERFVKEYPEMIKDLVQSWRSAWGYEFPFLSVQLPAYGNVRLMRDQLTNQMVPDNSGESWAWMREAQLALLSLPKTEVAVALDAGEYLDIHPQNKRPIGERLACLVASIDVPSMKARSPMMDSVEFKDGRAYIHFNNTAGGLESRRVAINKRGSRQPGEDTEAFVVSADTLSGFKISGENQHFYAAQAVIEGDTVCVWSEDVASPVAVRYAWANFPLANLYNSEGLPASPFRTDSFDMPDFDKVPVSEEGKEGKFNRDDTAANADASVSIGANYELVRVAGDYAPTAKITSGQVEMGQLGANANHPTLLYKGMVLPDTAVSGNSFSVSGNIITVPGVAGAHHYGLCFNRLDDGSLYAARINTGSTTVLQFIRINSAGTVGVVGYRTNSTPLAVSSTYGLTVSSSEPGVFSYTLTGASLDNGGTLSGTVTDTVLQLNGGYAGFYNSFGNTGPRFDDLSIVIVPF
jgi:sialate O-acetylesterase